MWSRNKVIAFLCIIGVIGAVVYVKNANSVYHGKSKHLVEYFNPHSEGTPWLSLNGVKYSNVAGFAPYHLEVPDTDYIFFVINHEERGSDAYFVSTLSGEEVVFKNFASSPMLDIGNSNPDYTVRIAKSDGQNVVVEEVFEGNSVLYTFDLHAVSVKRSAPSN